MIPSISPGPLSIELHRESPVNMVAHLYWSDCNVTSWHWSWLSRSQRHVSHLHCSELCKPPREGAILRVEYPELIGYIRVVCNFYFEGLCWNPSFRMEYPWDCNNLSLPMLDTEVEQQWLGSQNKLVKYGHSLVSVRVEGCLFLSFPEKSHIIKTWKY